MSVATVAEAQTAYEQLSSYYEQTLSVLSADSVDWERIEELSAQSASLMNELNNWNPNIADDAQLRMLQQIAERCLAKQQQAHGALKALRTQARGEVQQQQKVTKALQAYQVQSSAQPRYQDKQL